MLTAILLRLLPLWNWLRGAAGALRGLIGRYPLQAALIASLCLSGWLWHGWDREKAHHLSDRAAAEETMRQFRAASDANAAAAIAQVKAAEARSAQQAKDNTHVETEIRTVYRDRAGAYADRMRLDQVCRSDPAAATQDHPAPLDHGPGGEAVVLERADFDQLVANTARLEAAHEWGEGLIRDGAAVALPELVQ
ncbi:MAG: hypothetical protein KGM49_00700 [Sphingomonadales bacterium]|nr:hypothetical protein [Sphingomonadales bacterium]